jgi:hypothetical protein
MRTWVQRIRAISPGIGIALVMSAAAASSQAQTGQVPAGQTPAGPAPAGQAPAASQDDPAKVQEVFTQLRAAMGGDKAAAMKSLSAEGGSRVTFGDREVTNDVQFKIVLPDHIMRIMTPEMPNGMPGPRLAMTMNGTEAWAGSLDPMPNFGGGPGGGGGGQRGGGGGGPMAMFGGGGADQAQRVRGDMLRFALGIVSAPDALPGVTFSYMGTAQSKDGGEADVLGVKSEGLDAKLFVDKKTHLPLMVTYMARDMTRLRPPRPNQADQPPADPKETDEERQKRVAAEMQKRREEARKQYENAPLVENQLFYADYKKVDGVMLPHRFTRAVNGNPAEETEIKKYKINPKIDLNDFQKKGS